MREDIEHRFVTLAINTTKMTARALKNAISKFLNNNIRPTRGFSQDRQKSQDSPKRGKQSVKQLVGQGQGISNIEITDSNIKSFERVARKYGVDYPLKAEKQPKAEKKKGVGALKPTTPKRVLHDRSTRLI